MKIGFLIRPQNSFGFPLVKLLRVPAGVTQSHSNIRLC